MVHHRSEQYFGCPSDMVSSAEHIRDKMKLVEEKMSQQEKGAQPLKEEEFKIDPQDC